MFRREAKVEAPPSVMSIIPEACIDINVAAPTDYLKVCEAAGAKHIADILRLHTLLSVEVGKIYSIEEVNRFLLGRRPKDTQVVWKPLSGKLYAQQRSWRYHRLDAGDQYVYLAREPMYSKLVPQRALELISTIEKEIPDTFGYYVSDYDVYRPDPFLLVSHVAANKEWVIYHWNEPDWKG